MDCIFCKIAQNQIEVNPLYEDEDLIAFYDLHPQAPIHFLVVPKTHIATINHLESGDEHLIGKMVLTAKTLAKQLDLAQDGYRLIFNVNEHGGQTVYHIHLHVIGGRKMHWPPG